MYFLLDEYITECACTPDAGLCWKMFGARPIGSSGPFTFNPNGQPLQIEINNEVITITSPSQVLPGGDNPEITDWTSGPLEYAFLYSSACPSDTGCSDTSLFIVTADNCCAGEVTIFENECDLTSTITNITTPIYQWQFLLGGVWTNITEFGDGPTYAGEDNVTYRLCVEDASDSCIYYSNVVVGDCPEPPCTISCNLTWNEALSRLEFTYNASGGSGLFEVQFNLMNNCNPPQGVGLPQCVQVVPAGIGTVFCSQAPSTEERCFRAVMYDDANPGNCLCVDYVTVPPSAPTCDVTISSSLEACTSTIDGPFNSGGVVLGADLVTMQDDTVWQELDWYRQLDICSAGAELQIQPQSYSASGANQNSAQSYRPACGYAMIGSDGGNNGVDGDYVSVITLNDNLGNTIFANIDPANLNPDYADGPGGSVNHDDLYVTNFAGSAAAAAQENLMIDAYTALIINILDHEFNASPKSSPTDTSPGDYWLSVDANLNSNNNVAWLDVFFLCKHNATGLWCGPAAGDQAKVDSSVSPDTVLVTVGDGGLAGFGASNISCSADTPCGNIYTGRYTIVPMDDALDTSLTDYITVVASSATTDTDLGPLSPLTNSPLSCNIFQLTANANGNGTPTYVWSTGETTQTIQVSSGTYSVTVFFDDGCEATAQITV